MTLRRLGPGSYETLDGRYRIERQDGETECSHPLCDPLHERYWTYTRDGRGSMHWVDYVSWHVWDVAKDDYAGSGGTAADFASKREAVEWLRLHLATRRVFLTVRQDYRRPLGGSFANERYLALSWNTSPDPKDWGGPVDLGLSEFDADVATAAAVAQGLAVVTSWAFLPLPGVWRAEGRYA
jgi:hypothetical protein